MTLLIMAAGMGSRFGGIKQIQPVGAYGELIIDYSVFDAIAVGFKRVVFVIRREIERDFCEAVFNRIKAGGKIKAEYIFQDITDLPTEFEMPEGRAKPWGTGHAVLAARHVINEPFCVINADEFYGRDSYAKIAEFFKSLNTGSKNRYVLVTQKLSNVLSKHGTVSRGICEIDETGNVTEINERTKVFEHNGEIGYTQDGGDFHRLSSAADVNVNFFGFTAELMPALWQKFENFLKDLSDPLKSEFYLPVAISDLIKEGKITLKKVSSRSKWLSVTYSNDAPVVKDEISNLIKSGEYPSPLWK